MKQNEILQLLKDKSLTKEEITELVWLLNKPFYYERPVTIDQFCDSDDFVHKKWPNIFPLWRKTLRELYPTPFTSPYNEIIISAAAGAGKTTVATIGVLYDLYKLGCLVDPCKYYGLAPNTMLIMAIFSATGTTVAVNWNDITTGIASCPWLNEKVIDRRGLEKKNGSLTPVEIVNGAYIQTGSKFQHSMGKAIFDALMDEAAFGGANIKDAQKTYNELSSRKATRFRSYSKTGELPGQLFLISSPKESTDFMQHRINVTEKADSRFTKIMKNISSWDANPATDGEDKFTVFVGNESKEPFLVTNEKLTYDDAPYLIYPPVSYYEDFKKDLLGSIMNFGGVTTISDINLFKSPSMLNAAMVLKNPFKSNIIKLPFSKTEKQLMDFIDLDYFKNIRHPEYNRFIHIDAAFSSNTKDRYGLAACYCTIDRDTYKNNNDLSSATNTFLVNDRTYYVDFAIGIEPCKGQEVNLAKVQNFIIYLSKVLHYPIVGVSADTFESKQTLQTIKDELGDIVSNISPWRTRDPYLCLKSLVSDHKILLPKSKELYTELSQLKDDGKHCDHPITGSKDISDSVAGCIWNCFNSTNILNVSKVFSSSNIYQNKTQLEELEQIEYEKYKNTVIQKVLRGL